MGRGIAAGLLLGGGFLIVVLLTGRPDTVPTRASFTDGPAVYREFCAACHGLRGEGQAGLTPPLRGRGLSPAEVAEVVRKGRNRMSPIPALEGEPLENVARFVSEMR